jgi:regulator of cell morphogenesis and NO signaling
LEPSDDSKENDISGLTPGELTTHIESTYHGYLKEALPRLTILMEKVCQAHSSLHSELKTFQTVFVNLRVDLEPHLLKVKRILFLLIVKLEGYARVTNTSRNTTNSVHASFTWLGRAVVKGNEDIG